MFEGESLSGSLKDDLYERLFAEIERVCGIGPEFAERIKWLLTLRLLIVLLWHTVYVAPIWLVANRAQNLYVLRLVLQR